MRLLYLCADFGIDPAGTKGASIHLRAITRGLCELGHEVRLLSPKGDAGPEHPVRSLLGRLPLDGETLTRPLKDWLRGHNLGEELARELRPLLFGAGVTDSALRAAKAWRPDAILERLALHSHVGLDLAEALDVPLVVEVNALLTDEARRYRGLCLAEIAETIEQRVLARADAIVAVSRALADQLEARGVPARKLHVVPNGVDTELFAAPTDRDATRAALGLAPADFVIGFLGTLKPWHGADALLDAFARVAAALPQARLLLIGSGPQEDALRQQADRLGVGPRVRFTGALSHERVPALLHALDVAAAPYRNLEDFYFSPIKLFEYMAAGCCVVASRIGQIADVIHNEQNGLLCDPGNVEELTTTLRRVANDGALRARLSAAAVRDAAERHSWAHTARRVESAILNCRPTQAHAVEVG